MCVCKKIDGDYALQMKQAASRKVIEWRIMINLCPKLLLKLDLKHGHTTPVIRLFIRY